jgi:hypothetical protein
MNHMRAEPANSAADRLIARVAARQHGVISVAQLLAAGLSHRAIQVRVGAGRLHRIHRGVYESATGTSAVRGGGWQGIPKTTPGRTILDLRRVLNRDELQAAIGQAEIARLPIGRLSSFLHEPTRSELARRFLRLCKRAGLPAPEVNVRVGPYEVDFLWRDHRLIVETDGWETHRTRAAFELDRLRMPNSRPRALRWGDSPTGV